MLPPICLESEFNKWPILTNCTFESSCLCCIYLWCHDMSVKCVQPSPHEQSRLWLRCRDQLWLWLSQQRSYLKHINNITYETYCTHITRQQRCGLKSPQVTILMSCNLSENKWHETSTWTRSKTCDLTWLVWLLRWLVSSVFVFSFLLFVFVTFFV